MEFNQRAASERAGTKALAAALQARPRRPEKGMDLR